MKIKKRKKSKLEKTLEEGDLLFNLVMSVWFLILSLLFSGVFKLFFTYKTALFVSISIISALTINLIFKIVDIYMVYTEESISVRVQRELEEKRKLKQRLS